MGARDRLRWTIVDETAAPAQPTLFEEPPEREIGVGEYRGLEFLHVRAKRIINEVGPNSPVPFRYTINAYRGCSHACRYCAVGDTPILMADGRTKPLAELEVGDAIYGTQKDEKYRRYVPTTVLDKWSTTKPAYLTTLEDGTELITSGDHRFLSDRGWKHVTGAEQGRLRRPHLTLNNELMGTGRFASAPEPDEAYRTGYLCGMIRGDGHLGAYSYLRPTGRIDKVNSFRLALVDLEALRRTRDYLMESGIETREFVFQEAVGQRKPLSAIRTGARAAFTAISEIVRWPRRRCDQWRKGFLAGIFDAEGSRSAHALRIANSDSEIIDEITSALDYFGFRFVVETQPRENRTMFYVRIVGGLREHLRFFHTVDPAITRKRTIDGVAIKSDAQLRVESIEDLGIELPMYDITTGTGDFIANGVVSHNCFARPTHEYLNLNSGEDFERVIVVKINAVERVRAELTPKRWRGDHIAMGTNTDPYQRAEGKYHLTRGIVEVLTEAANPFSILTKNTLVLRDLDLLAEAATRADVHVNFSIGTLNEEVWRSTEPGTPHPRRRVEAVARLNEAGVPCGVLIAPILPGLSDRPDQLDEVVGACVEAGATSITSVLLHLRPGVREHYLGWLAEARPDLMEQHARLYRGSYAPAAERNRVSDLVQDLIRRHRDA
ncbi:MAG: radical SAM protein [Actinomycetota bacterium]